MNSAVLMERPPRDKSKDDSSSMVRNLLSLLPSRRDQGKSNLEHEALKLSVRDSEIFIDAIENPPQPSEGLLSVFE